MSIESLAKALLLGDAILQSLGGLEGGIFLGCDRDSRAGGGVTTLTLGTVLGVEIAESGNLDLAAGIELDCDDSVSGLGVVTPSPEQRILVMPGKPGLAKMKKPRSRYAPGPSRSEY